MLTAMTHTPCLDAGLSKRERGRAPERTRSAASRRRRCTPGRRIGRHSRSGPSVRGRSVRRRVRPRVHRLMGAVMKRASGVPSPHPRQPALHRRIPDAMLQWCACSARAKRRSPSGRGARRDRPSEAAQRRGTGRDRAAGPGTRGRGPGTPPAAPAAVRVPAQGLPRARADHAAAAHGPRPSSARRARGCRAGLLDLIRAIARSVSSPASARTSWPRGRRSVTSSSRRRRRSAEGRDRVRAWPTRCRARSRMP